MDEVGMKKTEKCREHKRIPGKRKREREREEKERADEMISFPDEFCRGARFHYFLLGTEWDPKVC